MKVYALSDIHADYEANRQWISNLSASDYRDDVLILAGDVSDALPLLESIFRSLAERFRKVLFVPGNHELWTVRDEAGMGSLEKFQRVRELADNCDVAMHPIRIDTLSVVPLLSWYDYSFGEPGRELRLAWADYRACRWPDGFGASEITEHFLELNQPSLNVVNETVISFSHFLPRIDVMPSAIPIDRRYIYPILGTAALDRQVRSLGPSIHVYGHSHVNRDVTIDGIRYVNNAFGYPQETRIAAKQLKCIFEL